MFDDTPVASLLAITKKRSRGMCYGAAALILVAGLSACGKKEAKSGQALASVNGEEITSLQLNEEMQRANVPPAQQQTASKQLLESLVDRQLLLNEAVRDKTDREPKVVQAIERAKALIVAQAYMQKRLASLPKPTKAEIKEYYDKHPEFFAQRKQLDLRQLIVASSSIDDALKKEMDAAKSLDEVAGWLDAHAIKYVRNQVSRSTSDLAPALSAKLLSLPKGQLIIIREGERSTLMSIADVRDAPADLASAEPQIEQFLVNSRSKDAATAEIARLRTAAKVEYLNKSLAPDATPAAAAASAPASSASSADNDRGVAGLK
jgi:peptidyl-prolyl cis-trans isomerase C